LASTTTVYLIAEASFSAGTVKGGGLIWARRARRSGPECGCPAGRGAGSIDGAAGGAIRKRSIGPGCNSNLAQVKSADRATCHTFRDTLASWLVQRGVSLFKVQQLLGHSTPTMTQKYAKLAPGAVADEAAAVLDALALERPRTEKSPVRQYVASAAGK
jgi:hypothetical protein